ncbi:helix-turn-helix transcriptional regulator [Propionibacterium freudenreichii]|uniref:helix-turn-helix transcriptional regulator n=1 Tax=Propionibacterium freudenreichii TaxID=1744 RepID=UPI000541EDAE|nr:helix-turn-helix transcriptional regulator [Propionibacterium freudenreichii]MCT2999339.1 XRE family transcriptional regulator [Propionibacterium freudenreichii]MDK9644894.1 helix-turn-helix transcriptional regulator [Propionibacterium freudenreichii]CEG85766.1 Putative uncharacterized protein [Propionibacterium freudenreichii]CEI24859.1 Putative uncharacterized protein [Propionibacterium freudenreichii]
MASTDFDTLIGDRVNQLRGTKVSQQALADAMRERGFKWNQATVWNVERGDRPLKLSEAEALAQMFHLRSIDELKPAAFREDYQKLLDATDRVGTAFEHARIALEELVRARQQLERTSIEASEEERSRLHDQLDFVNHLTPKRALRFAENPGRLPDDGKHPEAS